MSQRTYAKVFKPVESNPEIFTDLGHRLGLPDHIVFEELYSLDEPPDGKVLAYVLAFPTTPTYDAERAAQRHVSDVASDEMDVVFLKQTIHNACGLYALLHAACNGRARDLIRSDSILHSLIESPASERIHFLENSNEIEQIYALAAEHGDTVPPTDPDIEVDWHYTCFAPSSVSCKVYELDGDRQGPLTHARLADDLTDFESKAIDLLKECFEHEQGQKAIQFNVMVLVEQPKW